MTMTLTQTTSSGPYAQAARTYWDAGWRGILPLPAGRKKPVPSGRTGRGGTDPSYPDVWAWTEEQGAGNIALRMPHDVIGLDVDDYGDKAGIGTLALHEQMHGPLPRTWRSTSRDTRTGGIRFFRVPPGLEWPGELDGGGIEIIQRNHRYAVVFPSIHPEGGTYRWYDIDGNPSLTPPRPDQLPDLPEQWVTDLTHNQLATESTKVSVADQEAIAWLTTRDGAQDEPCPVMAEVLTAYYASDKSAHGAMNTAILSATRHADGLHPGAVGVVIAVRKHFIEKVTSPTHPSQRTKGEAEREYMRSLTGAVGICLGDPSPPACDCNGQLTATILAAATPEPASTPLEPVQVDLEPEATVEDSGPLASVPDAFDKFRLGGSFVLDAPDVAPALWGDGDDIIWAKGEALMIAGGPGVGKTTLAGQVVRGRLGLGGRLLGHPITPTASRVLYLAMDRPAQIRRSLRRHFDEADRALLDERLMVWEGPPPVDVARNPGILKALADLVGADTLIVDSLKDAAIGLVEDETGASYNRARQMCLANGIEVLELHHMVKRGEAGKKPNTLADVYGSMHLTSGAGSVVVLWGSAGDLVVEFLHLKQPMNDCGPLQVQHDHDAGLTAIVSGTDLLSIVAAAGSAGVSAKAAASAMFVKDEGEVTRNEKRKAARSLQRLVTLGHLESFEGPEYHGQSTLLYRAIEGAREGARPFSDVEGAGVRRGYASDENPSHEGAPEGAEGARVEGAECATPYRGGGAPSGTSAPRTLAACARCFAPTDIDELAANTDGWCDDCSGERENWYR